MLKPDSRGSRDRKRTSERPERMHQGPGTLPERSGQRSARRRDCPLIADGKRDEAERLQVEAAQDDEAAGLARTKRRRSATGGSPLRRVSPIRRRPANITPRPRSSTRTISMGMYWHADMEERAGNLAEAERAYNTVLGRGSLASIMMALLGQARPWQYSQGTRKPPGALNIYREAASDIDAPRQGQS